MAISIQIQRQQQNKRKDKLKEHFGRQNES
jgi:hypothetical protein